MSIECLRLKVSWFNARSDGPRPLWWCPATRRRLRCERHFGSCPCTRLVRAEMPANGARAYLRGAPIRSPGLSDARCKGRRCKSGRGAFGAKLRSDDDVVMIITARPIQTATLSYLSYLRKCSNSIATCTVFLTPSTQKTGIRTTAAQSRGSTTPPKSPGKPRPTFLRS